MLSCKTQVNEIERCAEITTDQFQDGNFHHALVEISGLVFNNLDRDYLMRLHVLTFDDLPESALTEYVEDQVSKIVKLFSVMSREEDIDGLVSLFSPQPIVDVENIVIVLIVISFVVGRLARLCEYSSWVMRRFILELRVTYAVGIDDMCSQLTQGLRHGH